MLILTAILIILLAPLVVLGLSFSRISPGYLWLLVMLSTLIAWGLVIMSNSQIPISIPLANWQPEYIFSSSPALLVDNNSWPFAVAALTLLLATLLSDIVHVNKVEPYTWAFSQAFGGVGLIAVIAGNPMTMLLSWALIDIAECVSLLPRMEGSSERERVVISFSVRIMGTVMLILAIIRANSLGSPLTFENIPSAVGGYLVLAAGLRLGAMSPYPHHLKEPNLRRGFGTLIHFIPIATSVVLLVRSAHFELMGTWIIVFLVLAMVTAILSAIAWVGAENELQVRPYWILGMSAFVLAAAVQGQPTASAIWGLAMIFSGALLFLFTIRYRWLLILLALGAVGFSGLPMSPSWEGSTFLFTLPLGFRFVFIISLALMFVGYLRYAWQPGPDSKDIERWMWLIYPIGLTLLPLTFYSLVYTRWILGYREISYLTPGWWSGLASFLIAATIIALNRFKIISLLRRSNRIRSVFAWVYRIFWWGYRELSRVLYVVIRLMEGDGSVLWALLFLIMLIVTINLWGGGDGLGF